MGLSPEDKRRIEEEEKYRLEVRQKEKTKRAGIGCLVVILIGILLALGIGTCVALTAGGDEAEPSLRDTRVPTARAVTPTRTPPLLEVQSSSCTVDSRIGFAYVRGEVKNISGESLGNVTAVASWYAGDGDFIKSDDALIDYNPILPGQVSPFETISTHNPVMGKCKVEFKFLLGGTIPTTKR